MDSGNLITDRKILKSAWEEFAANGETNCESVRSEILQSWKRCREFGLDPYSKRIEYHITEEEKQKILQENRYLIDIARPFLMSLYELVKSLEMVVFLTDSNGFILEAIGEGLIWEYCSSKNAVVGSSFDEKYTGTNAVAMALRFDRPYQMMAEEHYCILVHVATCAATPIHDDTGSIVGCLDITARYEIALKHPHTLGMIVAAGKFIESQLKLNKEMGNSFLIREYLKSAMESMDTGLIIINSDNGITHINSSAERIFGVSISTISDRKIETLIKNDILLDYLNRKEELLDQELILQESLRKMRLLASIKPIFNSGKVQVGSVISLRELKSVQKLVQKVVGAQARYRFEDIKGESEEIKETIRVGKAMAASPTTILIVGESGTGKEMISQSIHNASNCSDGPFLAINCAAIPHDLIESELFGYEAGTFTGGIKGGKSGKLELADGGTLFLDEVNGMSLDMQAKLLRVMEERKFLRLGGTKYIQLDVRIIAATNINLAREVEMGNFRRDLYYRLNVVEIHVPPLRERSGDIELLANLFVTEIANNLGKRVSGISPEALYYLESRPWLGNVRELKNWIERAVSLAEGDTLSVHDFPRDDGYMPISRVEKKHNHRETTSLDQVEHETIIAALQECNGNITEAAKRLGIGRTTLYRKMKKYNIGLSINVS